MSMWRLWIAFICLGIAGVLVYVLLMGGLPYGGGGGGGSGGGAPIGGGGGPGLIGTGSLSGDGGSGDLNVHASPTANASQHVRNDNGVGSTGSGLADQRGGGAPLGRLATPGFVQPSALIAPQPAPVATAISNAATAGVPVYAAPTFAPIGTSAQSQAQTKPTPAPEPKPSPTQHAPDAPAPQSSVFPTWAPYSASSPTPH